MFQSWKMTKLFDSCAARTPWPLFFEGPIQYPSKKGGDRIALKCAFGECRCWCVIGTCLSSEKIFPTLNSWQNPLSIPIGNSQNACFSLIWVQGDQIWRNFDIWQNYIVINGQILENNIATWSPCSSPTISLGCKRTSATRLGDFLKFLATNFMTKVAKIFDKLFGLSEKHHFQSKDYGD